jgi:hypothetical protein
MWEPARGLVGITPTAPRASDEGQTMRIVTAAILLLLLAGPAHAMEWRLGVAYASGLSDVTDLYEDNLRNAGFDVNVDLKFPLGLAASFVYDWPSGMRADVGLGPTFLIGGDIEHVEVPLTGTIGYNFTPEEAWTPYVRAGIVHHFASGDQYSSSTPGLFAAVGIDFTHVSFEIAIDRSEVEFDRLVCDAGGGDCELTKTDLNTYEVLAAVYWRFRLFR